MNINEIIDQIERGLEGVTPGPWGWAEGRPDVFAGWAGKPWTILQVKSTTLGWHENSTCASREAGKNAAHIARCDPDTMRAIIDAYRTMEARAEAAEVKVAMAQNLLKRVPGAINSAFAAGTEEREGGSTRRQAKAMAGPETLQCEIRDTLAAMENTDE